MAELEIRKNQWAAIRGAQQLIEALGVSVSLPGQVNIAPPGTSPGQRDHFLVSIASKDLTFKCAVIVEDGFPSMAWVAYAYVDGSFIPNTAKDPTSFRFKKDGTIIGDDDEKGKHFRKKLDYLRS